MVVSAAALTADEIARAAAGKPILAWKNAVDGIVAAEWSTVGTWSGSTDDAAVNYPVTRIYDRYADIDTRPDTSVVSATWYLLLELTPEDWDVASIWGHNLASAGATVQLQVADDGDFSTNLETVASWTPAQNTRLVDLELAHSSVVGAARLSGVQWARLRFTNCTVHPEISELFLGRRRQLGVGPDRPVDLEAEDSSFYDFESDAGTITRNVLNAGRRVPSLTWTNVKAAEKVLFREFWADSGFGAKSGILVLDSTTPADALWCMPPKRMRSPFTGPASHSIRLAFREQPPFLAEEP